MKKSYIKPTMMVVKLQHRANLLQYSGYEINKKEEEVSENDII